MGIPTALPLCRGTGRGWIKGLGKAFWVETWQMGVGVIYASCEARTKYLLAEMLQGTKASNG